MAQVLVSAELSAWIAAQIAAFIADTSDNHHWLAPFIARHNALPLYLGWGENWGITPAGNLVRWSTEGDYEGIRPIEERSTVLMTLVVGARKYPELGPLLPVRGPRSVECACLLHEVFRKILCPTCGGLGWLPAPEDQIPIRPASTPRG